MHYNINLYSVKTWQRSFVTTMVIIFSNNKCTCSGIVILSGLDSGCSNLGWSLGWGHWEVFLDSMIHSLNTSHCSITIDNSQGQKWSVSIQRQALWYNWRKCFFLFIRARSSHWLTHVMLARVRSIWGSRLKTKLGYIKLRSPGSNHQPKNRGLIFP